MHLHELVQAAYKIASINPGGARPLGPGSGAHLAVEDGSVIVVGGRSVSIGVRDRGRVVVVTTVSGPVLRTTPAAVIRYGKVN